MNDRDRKIADSGWGIKPDDQPANAQQPGAAGIRVYQYDASDPQIVRKVLQAQRRSFNTANQVRVEPGRTVVLDINKDEFVIEGLSYGDSNLIEVLKNLGASFSPPELAKLSKDEKGTREYSLSRVWAWGAERTG
ncbi:MAG TPA: hypothetical protein VH518_15020 [Tepidisphaeraceae bacterium]|jgi:hypothetical protein